MSSIKKGSLKSIALDKKRQSSPKNKVSKINKINNNDNICNDVDSTSPNSQIGRAHV